MKALAICEALTCEGYFLFCPNGDEKHFTINGRGVITQFENDLTIEDINFIRVELKEKLKVNGSNKQNP